MNDSKNYTEYCPSYIYGKEPDNRTLDQKLEYENERLFVYCNKCECFTPVDNRCKCKKRKK